MRYVCAKCGVSYYTMQGFRWVLGVGDICPNCAREADEAEKGKQSPPAEDFAQRALREHDLNEEEAQW